MINIEGKMRKTGRGKGKMEGFGEPIGIEELERKTRKT